MFFDDFDDDFFDDDFDDFDKDFASPAANDPYNELYKSKASSLGEPVKLLMLYDEGSLKSMLCKYLDLPEYIIIEANDTESAKQALKEHSDLGIIISNMTVAGVGAEIILKQLITVNPDLICIICTDMMDMRSFVGLINTSPIYKILTFPLDIDKDLIPAINELTGAYMVRKVNREDWLELQASNEALKKELVKIRHLSKIQHGCIRTLYSYLNELLLDNINVLCKSVPEDTKEKLTVFQKNVLEKFFLSLSPKEKPMEVTTSQLISKYSPEGTNKTVKIKVLEERIANPLLKSRATFLIWLYIYRISLLSDEYYITESVTFTGSKMAYFEFIYRFENDIWTEKNKDALQNSYTKVCEELTRGLTNEYRVDDRNNTVVFSGVIALDDSK